MAASDGAPGYRVAACYETAQLLQPGAGVPDISASTFYRKKQRLSFEWQKGGWRVDVTRVESNEDADAESAIGEVEVEMCRTPDFYSVPLTVVVETGEQLARDLAAMQTPTH